MGVRTIFVFLCVAFFSLANASRHRKRCPAHLARSSLGADGAYGGGHYQQAASSSAMYSKSHGGGYGGGYEHAASSSVAYSKSYSGGYGGDYDHAGPGSSVSTKLSYSKAPSSYAAEPSVFSHSRPVVSSSSKLSGSASAPSSSRSSSSVSASMTSSSSKVSSSLSSVASSPSVASSSSVSSTLSSSSSSSLSSSSSASSTISSTFSSSIITSSSTLSSTSSVISSTTSSAPPPIVTQCSATQFTYCFARNANSNALCDCGIPVGPRPAICYGTGICPNGSGPNTPACATDADCTQFGGQYCVYDYAGICDGSPTICAAPDGCPTTVPVSKRARRELEDVFFKATMSKRVVDGNIQARRIPVGRM